MAHISENIKSSNHKIDFYDHMGKIIVSLGNNKCENNNNSICRLNHIQKSLSMSILDTSKKDVSNFDRKLYKRKVCTYSIKSSSTLFYCSIRAMYNIVHHAQNKRPVLNSYTPEINTSIFPKKIY